MAVKKVKKNWINRAKLISSSHTQYHNELCNIKQNIIDNGFPNQVC